MAAMHPARPPPMIKTSVSIGMTSTFMVLSPPSDSRSGQ
jgi:hypothetical protein